MWDLGHEVLERVGLESTLPLDDIAVLTASRSAFAQVKEGLTLGVGADSPLGSALD